MRNDKLALALVLALPCSGATKLILRNTASALGPEVLTAPGYGCAVGVLTRVNKLASTSQGSSAQIWTFAPTSTAPPCLSQSASSSATVARWVSPPVSASLAVSGNIDYSAGCAESAAQTNYGYRMTIWRWSVKTGGIVGPAIDTGASAECTASTSTRAQVAAAAANATPTMEVGDRFVIVVEAMNVGAWGGNGTRTVTFGFDGAAGTGTPNGDAYVNFVTPTFSFSADTNNAPARVSRMLWDLLLAFLTPKGLS